MTDLAEAIVIASLLNDSVRGRFAFRDVAGAVAIVARRVTRTLADEGATALVVRDTSRAGLAHLTPTLAPVSVARLSLSPREPTQAVPTSVVRREGRWVPVRALDRLAERPECARRAGNDRVRITILKYQS